jgi:putative glutamine amidotransferase
MPTNVSPLPIGIYGPDDTDSHARHGCGLWQAGYTASVTAAGGQPFLIDPESTDAASWAELLDGLQGVILVGSDRNDDQLLSEGGSLCEWCRKHHFPLLGIDRGLHILNQTCGGTLYTDLPIELPEALQHRHPPEKGVRHAINVERGTRLAEMYGEGEIVVNSEHHRAIQRVARGFQVSARALDGVIEAIESESTSWFAMGVQWHPASETASGLDIQLFRGFIEACRRRGTRTATTARVHAA